MQDKVLIILHEIYGVNTFIHEQAHKYRVLGFEVICPNLLNRPPFPYEQEQNAYDYFMSQIGFDSYREVERIMIELKQKGKKVYVLGFSIGATIAWRCAENGLCDGLICCYGSRIREYVDLVPICPTLLVFAKNESFDVLKVCDQLQKKRYTSVIIKETDHGFMDAYGRHYDKKQAEETDVTIKSFLLKQVGID